MVASKVQVGPSPNMGAPGLPKPRPPPPPPKPLAPPKLPAREPPKELRPDWGPAGRVDGAWGAVGVVASRVPGVSVVRAGALSVVGSCGGVGCARRMAAGSRADVSSRMMARLPRADKARRLRRGFRIARIRSSKVNGRAMATAAPAKRSAGPGVTL